MQYQWSFLCFLQKEQKIMLVFQAVRQLLPNFMPERVMSDFELSELNAIDQLFPESQKSGKAKLKYKINIKKYYIKYPRL